MKAIHVNWTAPFFAKNPNQYYDLTDYQVLYTILSALRWKLHNGPIKLYTDSIGMSYYKQNGFLHLYDEVDIAKLNSLQHVDAGNFITSGKVHALENETEPFVFLDQDFIIRDKVDPKFYETDITFAHWEIPRGDAYCSNKTEWESSIKNIKVPENYDFLSYSPNTCFVCYNNLEVVQEYVNWHKKLIEVNQNELPLWYWLVTDQGILGHLIKENKLNIETLTDKIYLPYSYYLDSELIYQKVKEGYPHQWHWPLEFDKTKENIDWEHVWLAKNMWADKPEILKPESQRYFNEIWALGGKNYLNHYRFSKYWNKDTHGQ